MNFRNQANQTNQLKNSQNGERIIPFLTGFALGIPFGGRQNYNYYQPYPYYQPWFYPPFPYRRYPYRRPRRY